MKISEILKKYNTDKNKKIRKRNWHCYGKAYDHLFKSFDRKAKLDILEIGTEYGESLLAWREYFPNASITGVDIIDRVKDKDPSIEYIVSDINDFDTAIDYDIVIDDGSHKLKDVLHTIHQIKIKVGGIMVIEDVQAPHRLTAIDTDYSIERIDLREVSGQYDDFLIVLRNYGYFNL